MGRDACQTSTAARTLFEEADRILERPLSRLCFDGPDDELRRTENAQPALFLCGLAYLAAAREAGADVGQPVFAAGHSLGEYTALAAAGSISFETGLRLVAERGRLMSEAGRSAPGTMAAIMGLAGDAIRDLCRQAGAELCNLNSPAQSVVGGRPEAVERAMALARERGGKATALNVSGAFHTSLMRPVAENLAERIAAAEIGRPQVPVIGNSTARALTTADEVRRELVAQLTSPVLWQASVEYMAGEGVTLFIEFGPGRVLTGLIRRIAPGVRVQNVNGAAGLAAAGGA